MNKTRQSIIYYLGTGIMLLSVLGFVVIFSPLALTYISPPKVISNITAFTIRIPKINAVAPIVQNVDPFVEIEYEAALKRGVAHARGTSLPGGSGTIFLFAHSSGLPWEITRYNTVFLRLGELTKGDTIIIMREGKTFTYTVEEMKIVAPTDVQYLVNTQKSQLILQTCTPIGTALNRLLIFASPIT